MKQLKEVGNYHITILETAAIIIAVYLVRCSCLQSLDSNIMKKKNGDYRIFPVLENSTLHLWYFSIKEAPLKVFSNLILNIAIHPET